MSNLLNDKKLKKKSAKKRPATEPVKKRPATEPAKKRPATEPAKKPETTLNKHKHLSYGKY